ncbi:uncharacterized protein N7511_007842 [Penicillium nucicola]|uniref:uncharacterized protein n=1 Tax=Penicillium nucicola TaxID=1850975 RepID=UPI0025454A31|nr:uncharacterized protein N7511_007842 [Penicillium nucicola]KAJ5753689.1 hypothetical protein N7511_007842 [Penicillium nucicola]
MKSFSSSVINKTGKKFAPKAPIRRAPAAAPARRPSAVQQAQVQAAQAQITQPDKQDEPDKRDNVAGSTPASEHVVPEALAVENAQVQKVDAAPIEAPVTSSRNVHIGKVDAAPTEPPVASGFDIPIAKVDAPFETHAATPIAIPTPKPTTTSIPKPVARSIPPPKRKASVLETTSQEPAAPPIPPPTQSSQPTTASTSTSVTQHGPTRDEPEAALIEYARVEAARAAENLVDNQPSLVSEQPQPFSQANAATPEIRPAKRRKSSVTTIAKPGRKKSVSTVASASSSRRGSQSVVPTIEDPSGTPGVSATSSTPEPSQAKTKKRKYSKAGTSDPEGSEKPKRARKKREPTPEGAETVEILPNVVKMSELCKDLRTGKKSKRETELRKMDQAEEERKKTGTPAPGTPVKQNEPEQDNVERPLDWKPQSGPIMRIVNGEIVLDNTSLQVDRHADAARAAGDLEDVVESNLTRKVNQATYGKRSKTETWDEEMTDLFYRGLRMFGTDFMVISKMFPGRSRRQIKLKFNNEERRDPQRIKDTLLGPREHIDIATYSEMTNTTYDDPKVVQQELDDEKKRIEDQHAKEKQLQEEMLNNPTGDTKDEKIEKVPAKRSRKKQAQDMAGGTEEVLGSIDDFPMA